jgi:hypothetical protein
MFVLYEVFGCLFKIIKLGNPERFSKQIFGFFGIFPQNSKLENDFDLNVGSAGI